MPSASCGKTFLSLSSEKTAVKDVSVLTFEVEVRAIQPRILEISGLRGSLAILGHYLPSERESIEFRKIETFSVSLNFSE